MHMSLCDLRYFTPSSYKQTNYLCTEKQIENGKEKVGLFDTRIRKNAIDRPLELKWYDLKGR